MKKFRKMFDGDLDEALKQLKELKKLLDKVDKLLKDFENGI